MNLDEELDNQKTKINGNKTNRNKQFKRQK